MTTTRKVPIIFGVVAVFVLLGGFGIWYQFFRDTAPPPASIESAVEFTQPTATAEAAPAEATAGGTATSPVTATEPATATSVAMNPTPEATAAEPTQQAPEPTPTIQTEDVATLSGEWLIAAIDERFVGYRIGEELATIGTTEAVGRTSQVEGSGTIDGMALVAAGFTVDMTTLQSDDSRRDNQLRNQSLETNAFPKASFQLTTPVDLPDDLVEGEPVSITASGDLTLHGVTREVELPLDIQLVNDILVVVGSLDITLSDFDIAAPRAPSVLQVNDYATLEIQLYFARD